MFAALAWPAAILCAETPDPQAAPTAQSVAGQLLVATPELGDPRFDHAVILMVRHNGEGAFGIVINQPVEERPIADLLKAIGETDKGVEGSVRIFAGGPVEPRIGFIVHSTDYHRSETLGIDEHVAVTSTPEILRDIGHKKGPKKILVAFGYAGWQAGQLERELDNHDWATASDDPALLFDLDRDKVWDLAWARRTISL